jgi:hypothetical protein
VATGDLRPSVSECNTSDVLACDMVSCVTEYLSDFSGRPATAMFMLQCFYCESEMSRIIRKFIACLPDYRHHGLEDHNSALSKNHIYNRG